MSQSNHNIGNVNAPTFRANLNSSLQALASLNSGNAPPSTTYANMLWYEEDTNILKMRNEANSAWIDIGYLDQSAGAFRILDDTQVVNTSGTQTGLLGDQAAATWEAGTGTTESLISPAKVKAAIDALQYKPFAEAYVTYSGTTPTMVAEYGMDTVSRSGAGDTAFVFDVAQPDTNYVIESHVQNVLNTTDARYQYWVLAKSKTGFTVRWRFANLVAVDLDISVVCKRLT